MRRAGQRVVWFDAIDVAVTVERIVEDAILPVPVAVCAADTKSVGAISSELRAARIAPLDRPEDDPDGRCSLRCRRRSAA